MQKHNNNSAACNTIKIIEAKQVHVSGMAKCHIKSFPGRFMTEMGYNWLCALYLFFIRHNGGICRVAVDTNSKVVGLAVGGNPHDGFHHPEDSRGPGSRGNLSLSGAIRRDSGFPL